MDSLKEEFKLNEFSKGGLILSLRITKGRPLTIKETATLEKYLRDINETKEAADSLEKELIKQLDKEFSSPNKT